MIALIPKEQQTNKYFWFNYLILFLILNPLFKFSLKDCSRVRLVVCGPSLHSTIETEPRIAKLKTTEDTGYAKHGKLRISILETVCMLEEICFISLIDQTSNEPDKPVKISISRRSGIPIFLMFSTRAVMVSFVTAVSGYYRLSEKWTYDLCEACAHPSLQFLTK